MRKLLKSKKALSPVVAAIILIAVTVAVSIAVAAWMGSLSMGFMETKELTISSIEVNNHNATANPDTMIIDATNTGTGDVTVASAKINGQTASITTPAAGQFTVNAGESTTSPVTITAGQNLISGNKYTLTLQASDGTIICSYTDMA
jgi:flagellin-like protein